MNSHPGGGEIVRCHSGYTYAQRPMSFRHEGKEYQIERIIAEKRTPWGKSFLVAAESGGVFELSYDESGDAWQVQPFANPRE